MEQKTKLNSAESAISFGKLKSDSFFDTLMSVDFNNRNEEVKYK